MFKLIINQCPQGHINQINMGRTKLSFEQILEEESQREREEGRDVLGEMHFQSGNEMLKDLFQSFLEINSQMVQDNKNQTDGNTN